MIIKLFPENKPVKEFKEFNRIIYKQNMLFRNSNDFACIEIEIANKDEIKKGYINQIGTTLRILFLNYGFSFIVDNSNNAIIKDNLNELNHQSCCKIGKSIKLRNALNYNLNDFFTRYKSNKNIYKYLNNSIPWLLLINQIKIEIVQLRIKFTLIDMLGRVYTNSTTNADIFNAFIKNNYNNNMKKIFDDFYAKYFISIKNYNGNQIKGKSFNSINDVINTVIGNNQAYPNKIDEIAGVIYKLRCRYFHGNMSPAYPYDNLIGAMIVDIEKIIYLGINETIRELMNKI